MQVLFHLSCMQPSTPSSICMIPDQAAPAKKKKKMLYSGLAAIEWYDLEANLSAFPVREKPVLSCCLLFIYEQVWLHVFHHS